MLHDSSGLGHVRISTVFLNPSKAAPPKCDVTVAVIPEKVHKPAHLRTGQHAPCHVSQQGQ